MTKHYDILVVGAGLFGSVVAHEAVRSGKKVLVIDRRSHIGGNCYSYKREGIEVHAYGPHVFHTNSKDIWRWIGQFSDFSPCMISPVANYKGELYNLPFNMNTFHALWGVVTPMEAQETINQQRVPCKNPRNLEERVLDMVGQDIYRKLVKGYAEKQYGKPCSELPASLISRMPVLFTYDNDYLHKRFQGVPESGYGALFDAMLERADVLLQEDFLLQRNRYTALAEEVVFTGPIDEYYEYQYGPLEYRGRRFEHHLLEVENYQGAALMNYTDAETSQLRIIEHKHFAECSSKKTIVTFEYATPWSVGDEPYYTANDDENFERYRKYNMLALKTPHVHFGGRLGEYRYYDMQDTVKSALRMSEQLLGTKVPRA